MSEKNKVGAVMIVGAGIGGCQAALDLADAGLKVYLVDKQPSIGGVMAQLDKTFPTNDCSMCILAPKLVAVDRHPDIELITYADIINLEGEAGNFNATINKRTRYIYENKCTGCGECIQECPVEVPDEFNQKLNNRKAIYLQFPQAVPFKVQIDKRGIPPCVDACPAHVNAQGYVALISKKSYKEALNLIRERCPLPSVIGRICPHFCEEVCNRAEIDDSINICGLKRFVADYVMDNLKEEITFLEDKKVEKVAIVGSGPAGLTVAYHLAKLGYPVTIFEKEPVAGGMLRLGIPDYRLPPEILERDIEYIKKLGVEIKTNTPIGPDLTLEDLKNQGYKAIFIAIGLHNSRKMDFECENIDDVIYGVDFLKEVNLSRNVPNLKDKVVGIVGGGDVAMDAARSSIRLGAKKVIIIYRRSEQEMPASREEIERAREEGIEFKFLTVPTKDASGKKVKLAEIECVQMKLGKPDESGRRRPIAIEGSEFKMKIDTLIISVGQEPDCSLVESASQNKLNINKWGYIEADKTTFKTNISGVFAGGEITTGAGSAIEAIATGNKAAIVIEKYLKGEEISELKETIPDYKVEDVVTIADIEDVDSVACQDRGEFSICLPEERIYNFNEVASTMDEDSSIEEAQRCLNCGSCCECFECVRTCQANAVDHNLTDETISINIGAVILALGSDEYEPKIGNIYGYGEYPNVISSIEFERILNASGPFKGEVIRPSDKMHPEKIAFLQCVGSRDKKINHEYCSSVCCMYTTKEAVIAKEHLNTLEPTIFSMDIRAYGKDFDKYIERAKSDYGIRYIRSRISTIKEITESNDLKIRFETDEGEIKEEIFNMVVLSVGLQPNSNAIALAKKLNVELNEYNFCKTSTFNPIETSRPGIYVCGTFKEPKDIPETVVEASAAAGAVNVLLSDVRNTLVAEKKYYDEIDVSGEPPRIGVFVCHCGINIGGVVDVPEVVEYASKLPDVVYTERNLYTCSADTQTIIKEKIKEYNLNRVIVASCTPRTHEPLFQATIREAGLNKYLFDLANIRDQCSWVHMHEPEKATEKAKDLVRMSVAKARNLVPLQEQRVEVVNKGLVIGGGVAGMTAALNLADQGYTTYLIEKGDKLGGFANQIYQTLENNDVQMLITNLVERVNNHEFINVFLEANINSVTGYLGNFTTEIILEGGNEETKLNHGIIIVATGTEEYLPKDNEFLYNKDERIITQSKLEEILFMDENKIKELKSIVMIQCIGSRNDEHPYCSRMCCAEAIKNALKAKEINPDINITILFRDIRTYGFKEKYYNLAREKGILFIRFDEKQPPEVINKDNELQVILDKSDLGEIKINTDMAVLSAGIEAPEGNFELAKLLKVPLNEDNFFLEAHVKLRPSDFATDGIFLCGTARGPANISESIAQANSAAARAMTILSKEILETEGVTSYVNEDKCIGCGQCAEICPYNAIELVETTKQMGLYSNDIKKAHVIKALCKGCGTCFAECPVSAISMSHFGNEQIKPMITEAVKSEEKAWEPRIVAFLCNWCSYAGADLAGVSRYQYPPNLRIIRVMCSGGMSKSYILKAFLDGADGVFIAGCHLGDCHYISGNENAYLRLENLQKLLKMVGIEEERIQIHQISASEGKQFSEHISEFTEIIKKLGESKIPSKVSKAKIGSN
ncbi:MAG: FAD-dependent oxidoreductase [Candidatus Hermodarchaeota archaeon]